MNNASIQTDTNAPTDLLVQPLPAVQYVVYEEHTLGYILAQLPETLQILHSSVIRGGYSRLTGSVPISLFEKIRPATIEDFNDYRVCHKGHLADAPEQFRT